MRRIIKIPQYGRFWMQLSWTTFFPTEKVELVLLLRLLLLRCYVIQSQQPIIFEHFMQLSANNLISKKHNLIMRVTSISCMEIKGRYSFLRYSGKISCMETDLKYLKNRLCHLGWKICVVNFNINPRPLSKAK